MLASIFFRFTDWTANDADYTLFFEERKDCILVLTVVFYIIVSVLYRANDVLDTSKTEGL